MSRNYYYLVSSLREYNFDGDAKGFDAPELREEIASAMEGDDYAALRQFYSFYDICNIINILEHKEAFNTLGNFSKEELLEEVEHPINLPQYIANVLIAYKNKEKEDKQLDVDESIDSSLPIVTNLWNRFYEESSRSGVRFVKEWYEFDRQSRNIAAAYTARHKGLDVSSQLIGDDDTLVALSKNSAPDFGLKNEIDYIDKLIQILDNRNMLDKERRFDLLRWEMVEELTEGDYFNTNKVLAYCAKINIIHRWLALDKDTGREMLKRLITELSQREIVDSAIAGLESA